ncbi:DUF6078 family protein [Bacteroides sp. 224]|uniref:DUF6078 family protein n=1 Tax=Bacteroides sp. 224 TaxID=2302936 RepID=UPI0013D5843B|nr:DUF6078 family protein [Bacteroides sp. 224]NDV66391.1 hypothetical protein [Bacteroides sp. 224]
MENNLDYQLVPDYYAHCLNEQCSRRSQCLRHLVAQADTSQHNVIRIINPKSIPADTNNCPFFKSNRKIRKAWGVKHLLDNVPYKDGSSIRQQLIDYFGRNMYYHIYRLERGILPEEQAYIQNVFRANGIAEEPQYEKYTEEYDFR